MKFLIRAGMIGVALFAIGCSDDTSGPEKNEEITIGGLFSLTGNWATLGEASKAALEIAITDINAALADGSSGLTFKSVVEDTKLDPAIALTAAQRLRSQGVEVAIGPQSSAEVERLKSFTDTAKFIIASQSSTAASLAIANDNILRFTPGDSLESIAIVGLMEADGIDDVVPMWRGDAGLRGLATSTRARMTAGGGMVSAGSEYATTETNFAARLATIKTQVEAAIARSGAAHTAVFLAAFDEAAQILAAAAPDPVLGSVRWYGTDGTALSTVIENNATAAAFAVKVSFANPIPGLDDANTERWQPIATRIKAVTGRDPDGFALAVYDAAWIAARAYLAIGGKGNVPLLRTRMIDEAGAYFGATGWTALNAAGDRRNGNFDFFALTPAGAAFDWTRVAQFDTQTGTLRR